MGEKKKDNFYRDFLHNLMLVKANENKLYLNEKLPKIDYFKSPFTDLQEERKQCYF